MRSVMLPMMMSDRTNSRIQGRLPRRSARSWRTVDGAVPAGCTRSVVVAKVMAKMTAAARPQTTIVSVQPRAVLPPPSHATSRGDATVTRKPPAKLATKREALMAVRSRGSCEITPDNAL